VLFWTKPQLGRWPLCPLPQLEWRQVELELPLAQQRLVLVLGAEVDAAGNRLAGGERMVELKDNEKYFNFGVAGGNRRLGILVVSESGRGN